MKSWTLFLLLGLQFLPGCSDKYRLFEKNYPFRSPDGKPDYANPDYWAALPGKKDPSDSIPAPLRRQQRDSAVDVFFLHPTTFTKKKDKHQSNAAIDDAYLNAKTDYSAILYQASVFNEQCRIYAPRYRQAHIHHFFSDDTAAAHRAFDLAYTDIKKAFEYYLKQENRGRPFIIAGHSQGAMHAMRLMKEYMDGTALSDQLVAAYVSGWPVPRNYFTALRMCEDSLQTGCLCSWRTFRKGYVPSYLKKEKGYALATNPLNWTTGDAYAPKSANRGSVLVKFNKVYPHTTDAQLANGMLFVKKPVFPWSFLYFTRNYHIADFNLFYLNIRGNILTRIRQWQGQ